MTFRYILYCVFCLLFVTSSQAQENVLSQFFANRIYLNPAFTGIEKGLQVTASIRQQWYQADRGYRFAAIAAEWQEPTWRSGFGLTVQGSFEGISPLSTAGASLSYAYVVPSKNGNVHLGVQYSYTQKRIDWSRLTFSDQLDPVFGSIYATGAQAALDVVNYHDFAFGALWRFDSKMLGGKRSIYQMRSHIGLSVQHLGSLFGQGPDESFLQTNTETPARITIHGGSIIPMTLLFGSSRKVLISPNVRFEVEGFRPGRLGESLTLFSCGAYFVVEQTILGAFYNSRTPLPGRRQTSSITLSLGFSQPDKQEKRHTYYVGASIDFNASGLGIRSGNIYELNLRYAFKRMRPLSEKKHPATTRKTVMDCKNFY